ncbi:trypsin-like peptidase domain-containing protein [Streptomyces sp. KR80]|uniref:trypsin-like peptidase domain-containing protein n=1 Tax=Streptomyces sp. KR80 TaxID=3457426 RepID=UPI003FD2ADAD
MWGVRGRTGGLWIKRVAEVIVRFPDGRGRRGSGYLAATGTVLTAAHVVEGAAAVHVRFDADRPGERTAEAAVEWADAGIDLAVLTVPGLDESVEPALLGRVSEQEAVLRCSAVGFPLFKLRTDDTDSSRYRDSAHVHATCAVLANRREGTLDLSVAAPAEMADRRESPWQGMSGAAVFSGGLLVGIVAEHHLADGLGRLAARRVDRWAEGLGDEGRRRLEQLLGCELRPDALPDAVPPSGLDLIETAYQALLADIAPEVLEDRGRECQRLVAFCAGTESYLWLQGPPWVGKTALVSWFALHPPRGVVPVWFFITNRLAEQADSAAYTEAVVHQLATIVGRLPAGHTSRAARDGERRQLLAEAAEKAARRHATLLLVVDGLDEDQSSQQSGAGPAGPSIAALLPERLPENVRVLVTSRPGPGLPPDVKGDHPLRHCPVEQVRPVAAARHTEYEARFDLSAALSGDRLGRDLVGLLAAARGSLTAEDLRELTDAGWYDLQQRLGSAFGRILRVGGDDSGGALYDSEGRRGYLFAHETLFATAIDALGPDVEPYRERVHTWAEQYAARGWPPGTPAYLLHAYGRVVTTLGDVGRATALASDAARHNRLREITGSDAAALAEIDAVQQLVRAKAPEDLTPPAALAAARDLVARRNATLHPAIPVALARLGHTRRAIGLAQSVFQAKDRALTLARTARALAETHDRRHAPGVAREAVLLSDAIWDEAAAQFPRWWDDMVEYELRAAANFFDEVLRTAAVALMAAGEESEALTLMHRLDPAAEHEADSDATFAQIRGLQGIGRQSWVRALAEVSAVARARGSARGVRLLKKAEKETARLPPADAIRAWAELAWTCGDDDAEHATRLHGRIQRCAAAHQDDPGVRAVAAAALPMGRPRTARMATSFALQAAREAEAALREPRQIFGSSTVVTGAVEALAHTGDVDAAEDLLLRTEELLRSHGGYSLLTEQGWDTLASAHARQGRMAKAWEAVTRVWESQEKKPGYCLPRSRFVTPVVDAPGAVTGVEELRSAIVATADSQPWLAAEGLATLAERLAENDPNLATDLVAEAEQVAARTRHGRPTHDQDLCLADLAGALAVAGRLADAEQLLGLIGNRRIRTMAATDVAATVAPEQPARALALVEVAIGGASVCDDPLRFSSVVAEADRLQPPFRGEERFSHLAAEALAQVGAVQQAQALLERCPLDRNAWSPLLRLDGQMMAAIAAALWRHDPLAALAVADTVEGQFLTVNPKDDGWAFDAICRAGVLTAAGHQNPRRIEELTGLLHRGTSKDSVDLKPQEQLLINLLTRGSDPTDAPRWLERLEALRQNSNEEPDINTEGSFALAHAALGRYEAAVHIATSLPDASERAQTLALLAGYLAGAPRHSVATRTRVFIPAVLPVVGRLTARTPPSDTPTAHDVARRVLSDVLATADWHCGLPALAVLAPGDVHRVRDVVFAHLGL